MYNDFIGYQLITENPCVPGSIPGGTTIHFRFSSEVDFLLGGISLLVVGRHCK